MVIEESDLNADYFYAEAPNGLGFRVNPESENSES